MDYTFGDFWGGISEDDKLSREAQVLYSEGLDLFSNSSYVTTSPLPENVFQYSSDGEALYFLKRELNVPIVGMDDNSIFRGSTKVYTNPYEVGAFWSNSKYLYWIDGAEKVSRILLTDVNSASWAGKVTITETNLESDAATQYFVIEEQDSSYIFYWTKIYEIINATGQIGNQYTFLYDKVVWVINLWSTLGIVQRDSKLFLWDKTSESPSQQFKYAFDVAMILQTGTSSQYIIGEGGLRRLEWDLTSTVVASSYNSDEMQRNKFNFKAYSSGSVGFLKDMAYIWVDDIWDIVIDDGEVFETRFGSSGVVSVWVKKSGFPDAISKFLVTSSDGSRYRQIFWVVAKSQAANGLWDGIYILYENENLVRGLDFVDLNEQNYPTSKQGLLILSTFDGGDKSIQKNLTKIKIRADFKDNGNIYVMYMKDWEPVYINGTKESSKVKHSDETQLKELTVQKNFYDISIVLFVDQTTSKPKNDSLRFYSINLEYVPTRR